MWVCKATYLRIGGSHLTGVLLDNLSWNDWETPLKPSFHLFVWLWWAGWCRCPQHGCEVPCRIHHTPPRPSHAGGSTAQLDALWWEHSDSWTAGRHMLNWNTAHQPRISLADSSVRTWRLPKQGVVFCWNRVSDPVGFRITQYLGVDPVQLQHQFVN